MKSEYQLNSAQDLKPEIVESIKLAFGKSPIRITVEDLSDPSFESKSTGQKYPKELTDTIIDLIFDKLNKRAK